MSCPGSVSTSTQDYNVINETTAGGNEEYNIPIKVGEPLSTACDRATIVGSIPEVIRHPAFTTINGGVAANKPSSGGLSEGSMKTFFHNDRGCYASDIALTASTCA